MKNKKPSFIINLLTILKLASTEDREIELARRGVHVATVTVSDGAIDYIYSNMRPRLKIGDWRLSPQDAVAKVLNKSLFDSVDAATPSNPNVVENSLAAMRSFLEWVERYKHFPPFEYLDERGELKAYDWTAEEKSIVPKDDGYKLVPFIRTAIYCNVRGLLNLLESTVDETDFYKISQFISLRYYVWAGTPTVREPPYSSSLWRMFYEDIVETFKSFYDY